MFDGKLRETTPTRSDALLATIGVESHASFLHRSARTGTLHCVWFTGDGEGEPGNGIAHATFDESSLQWSIPKWIVTETLYSMQNPVLYECAERLFLLHTRQDAGPLGVMQSTSDVLQWWSDDDGETWTRRDEPVFARGVGVFTRGATIAVGEHRRDLLLPVAFTPLGEFVNHGQRSALIRLRDGGEWSLDGGTEIAIPGTLNGVGIQPCVVRFTAADGSSRLAAFMRTCKARRGKMMRSESADDGVTWSPACATPLPNSMSAVTAVTLRDGRVLVVFNNALKQQERFPLTLALSDDGGVSFQRLRNIVSQQIKGGGMRGPAASPWGEHSYPSVWLDDDDDDTINMSWTHERQTVAFARLKLAYLDETERLKKNDEK